MTGKANDTSAMEVVSPTTWSGHTASSHIPFIRSSLKHQSESFSLLCAEIRSFNGLTDSEKEQLRNELREVYRKGNPSRSDAELEADVEKQVGFQSDNKFVFKRRFSTPYMSQVIPIILLSCALAEALINSLVAVGLINTKRKELFPMYDRLDLREKWRLGPTLFSDKLDPYFEKNEFSHLKRLIGLRNAFVHSKLDISVQDGSQLKGTSHFRLDMTERGQKDILVLSALPDKIFDLVLNAVPDIQMRWALETASFRFSV